MGVKTWMPLYVGDYLRDTTHLRAAESGAYLHLIMHYWLHGGLPDDDRQLATIAKMTDAEWEESRPVLEQFFEPEWRHARIDKEIEKAKQRYEKRAAAGRGGAKSRWGKERQNSQNEEADAHKHGNANGNAISKAMALQKHVSVIVSDRDNLHVGDPPEVKKHDEVTNSGAPRARERRAPPDWPEDFEAQFWSGYPHKVGKPKALEKLRLIARIGRVPWVELMDGLRRYVSGKPPDRQWCNPLTWLNQERWADEPAPLTFAHPTPGNGVTYLSGLTQEKSHAQTRELGVGFDETSPYDESGRPLGAAAYARKLARAAGYSDG